MAFDGIVPFTSAASSSRMEHESYDVFINHRGPDVKETLARSIYNSLNDTGLRVFLDTEELELGDFLPTAIQEAMRTASVHIAIFSQNYAQSPWCLAELAFMLETGNTIIPVFYHVQPYEVRWTEVKDRTEGKRQVYADALSDHEKKGRYTSEEIQRWKSALQRASYISGEIIDKKKNDEQTARKNVVNCVLKLMKKAPLEVAEHPVGLNEAVEEFEMTASPYERVQFVGICGMGGCGKTTLARELYNRKYSAERSSFLCDLRDAAGKSMLPQKQKKLLEDFGFKSESTFDNVAAGKKIIESRLRSISALIILDDVDQPDQLDALLPPKDSLGHGSLIIVTTRCKNVLTSRDISVVYQMRSLNPSDAEQLFCRHAFLQPSPVYGFEDLVNMFVNACQRLPLSLKVLGGQLCRQQKNYWESEFKKISRILPTEIESILKLSYDALDAEEKEMFLDTACFFIGEKNSVVIGLWHELWDGCGLHGLESLINKCLVELDEDNCIRMHDHLRDLGRKIANQQPPYRLFSSDQQIMGIHPQQESILIRGIRDARRRNAPGGFPRWSSQREIIVKTGEKTFRSLKPFMLELKFFVGSADFLNQELWEADADAPSQLIELDLVAGFNMFKGFPRSIGHLKRLKYIRVGYNDTMKSLPEEFCHLQSLEHLELSNCKNLSSLPSRFGDLRNLRHLNLEECRELWMLPDTFKQLTLLQHLSLYGCTMSFLESDILENMTKLECLNFSFCRPLVELPRHITDQTSLRELYLNGTSIREVAPNIGRLRKLEILEVGSELLTSLPTSVGNLSSLVKLGIICCTNLKTLPESLGDLSSLTELEISGCGKLKFLPESLGKLSSLTELIVTICNNLESLPESLGNLSFLTKLVISSRELKSLPESLGRLSLLEDFTIEYSARVKSLPKSFTQLINLQTLSIHFTPIRELSLGSSCRLKHINVDTAKVSKISISEDCCPCLKTLTLQRNEQLMEVETLPTTVETIEVYDCRMLKNIRGIRGVANLRTLRIKDCPELDALPSFAELTSLEEFELKGCQKVEKIEGSEHLRSLEKFETDSCLKVPCIVTSERLKELAVVANERSVAERCIPTIEKWPRDVMICTRAVFDVGSLVDSVHFSNLCVLSFAKAQIPRSIWEGDLEFRTENECSPPNATMICFIINCVSEVTNLFVATWPKVFWGFHSQLGKGKWVWIAVSKPDSSCRLLNEKIYKISELVDLNNAPRNEVEAGWMVSGKLERVVEASHRILNTFTK